MNILILSLQKSNDGKGKKNDEVLIFAKPLDSCFTLALDEDILTSSKWESPINP